MNTTRVLALDVRTGTRIAELDVQGLTYGSRLNSAGELAGSVFLPAIDTTAGAVLAAQINDAVDEGRRQIVVERDGVVVWSGIVWLSPYTDDPPRRTIRAGEDWSYWSHRFIVWDAVYSASTDDQNFIAQDLMAKAIAQPGGDPGLTIESSTSGIKRDRTYNAFELKPVAEAIEQLSAVNQGFDFAIDASYDPSTGALVKTFRTQYPRRGRPVSKTNHVFEVGRNVVDWSWPSDGTRIANKVYAIGRGEGDAMISSVVSDLYYVQPLSTGGPGYPLLESTLSQTDVSVQSTLDAMALARLLYSRTPVTLPEITVRADVDPVFGSYITGDSCRFVVPPGLSPRFPDGYDKNHRILGWDVSVSDEGSEKVKLILGEDF